MPLRQWDFPGSFGAVPVNPVYAPPDLASHDFEDSTLGPYTNPWGAGIDVIADPTPRATGKVARLHYSVANNSSDLAVTYTETVRYGVTRWYRFKLFYPASAHPEDNRKTVDLQGPGVRMTLHRVGLLSGDLMLKMSIVDWMNGTEQEVMDPDTGIILLDDTWYTIEIHMRTNSADNVRDGLLELYVNGATTPTFAQTTGLGWITEVVVPQSFIPGGGSYFLNHEFGSQLTSPNTYDEYRYIDDLAVSTQRIGP